MAGISAPRAENTPQCATSIRCVMRKRPLCLFPRASTEVTGRLPLLSQTVLAYHRDVPLGQLDIYAPSVPSEQCCPVEGSIMPVRQERVGKL